VIEQGRRHGLAAEHLQMAFDRACRQVIGWLVSTQQDPPSQRLALRPDHRVG